MTELEQKAEEYQKSLSDDYFENTNEQLEKEIADLKTRLQITEHRAQVNFDESAEAESKVRDLEKENKELKESGDLSSKTISDLTLKVSNLLAQIEKMKQCAI